MTKKQDSYQVFGDTTPITDLQGVYNTLAELGIVVAGGYRCVLYGWEEQEGKATWRPKAGASLGEGMDPSRAAKSLIAQAGASGEANFYRLETSPTRSMLKYQIEAVAVFPFTITTNLEEKRFVLYLDVLRGEETLDEERVERLGKVLRGLLSLAGGAISALLEVEVDRKRRRQADRPFRGDYSEFIGRSEALCSVLALVDRLAQTDFPVLVLGETGTGKELIGRGLHRNSKRPDGAFEALNCATLPEKLAESMLFGHVAGAFTDAQSDHRGVFELASGGTLFLDEIGDLTLEHQTKLLRVLDEGTIRPIGSETDRKVDVRIVSATNKDLQELVDRGDFRLDLFHRISTMTIELPSLKERREDIPELVRHFLKDSGKRVSPEALSRLVSLPWTGNIRELKGKVEGLATLSLGNIIEAADLDFLRLGGTVTPTNWVESWRSTERDFLVRLIAESPATSVEEIAKLLGKSRSWLYDKVKEHSIKMKDLLKAKAEKRDPQ
jgi:DNA-binding NtrC family response regulator